MKIATITPIYKSSGNLDDPSNVRQISLLPVISKIFENCIYVTLFKYLVKYNLISSKQFRSKGLEEI